MTDFLRMFRYFSDRHEIRGVFRDNAKQCFFREKPGFYNENPIAQRFGMGFSYVTIHALDRAYIVTMFPEYLQNI